MLIDSAVNISWYSGPVKLDQLGHVRVGDFKGILLI